LVIGVGVLPSATIGGQNRKPLLMATSGFSFHMIASVIRLSIGFSIT
jgi:hypothetical protein